MNQIIQNNIMYLQVLNKLRILWIIGIKYIKFLNIYNYKMVYHRREGCWYFKKSRNIQSACH